jgi:hypothetical protein
MLRRRETQDWLAIEGMDPLGGSPEDFVARVRSEIGSHSESNSRRAHAAELIGRGANQLSRLNSTGVNGS